jgi:hypothetical protein
VHDIGEHLETCIGHVDDAHVGVDGREGVVRRKAALLREGGEE